MSPLGWESEAGGQYLWLQKDFWSNKGILLKSCLPYVCICDARTGLEGKYVLPDWLVGGSWRLHVVCIFTVAWRVIAKCL